MQPIRINDQLSIAAQPELADFAALAQNFKSVINNRPDGEDATQPGSAAEAAAAQKAGLAYAHIPVGVGTVTEADIRQFQAALADGPVLAHCKSGMRSLMLFALGEVLDGRMPSQDISGFGRSHGYDFRAAEVWLAQHSSSNILN